MEHLKLNARFDKCFCDLLEYSELYCARSECGGTAPHMIVHGIDGVGRFEEYELCLEADEELYVEFLLCISIRITSSAHILADTMHHSKYFKIRFKFVLGHRGTSSRPPIDAFSSKNPNTDACPGVYPHSLRLERSTATRYSPSAENPSASLVRTKPNMALGTVTPGRDDSRSLLKWETVSI